MKKLIFCLSPVRSGSDDGRSIDPGAPKTHDAYHRWIFEELHLESLETKWTF